MEASEVLMEEHRIIERVLTALESRTRGLAKGQPVRAGFFLDAADFIKGFADGCHHQKEEGVLFKAMEAAGMPAQRSPIGVMLTEHEQGRAYTRAMREAAQRLEAGDIAARQAVVHNALGYVALLRQHIIKEDNVLYPMAERGIPAAQQEQMLEEFERIEREETGSGVHDKYLALATKLESEAAS